MVIYWIFSHLLFCCSSSVLKFNNEKLWATHHFPLVIQSIASFFCINFFVGFLLFQSFCCHTIAIKRVFIPLTCTSRDKTAEDRFDCEKALHLTELVDNACADEQRKVSGGKKNSRCDKIKITPCVSDTRVYLCLFVTDINWCFNEGSQFFALVVPISKTICHSRVSTLTNTLKSTMAFYATSFFFFALRSHFSHHLIRMSLSSPSETAEKRVFSSLSKTKWWFFDMILFFHASFDFLCRSIFIECQIF